jgi:hypothetical protein
MVRIALVAILLSYSLGCAEWPLEPAAHITYQDAVSLMDRYREHEQELPDNPKRQERQTRLQTELVGKPVAEVKAQFERKGYECSTFSATAGSLHDHISGSLTTGVLWLELPHEIARDRTIQLYGCMSKKDLNELAMELTFPKETIFIQYEQGIISRILVLSSVVPIGEFR